MPEAIKVTVEPYVITPPGGRVWGGTSGLDNKNLMDLDLKLGVKLNVRERTEYTLYCDNPLKDAAKFNRARLTSMGLKWAAFGAAIICSIIAGREAANIPDLPPANWLQPAVVSTLTFIAAVVSRGASRYSGLAAEVERQKREAIIQYIRPARL